MDNPKVSVLIPLYNRKQYAADCIDSVLNQTFQDFEIIIRDDRSTDGVYEFVQQNYAEQISSGKIRLFRNAENLGEGSNMNRLFRDARGKYLQVLHNDDILNNTALQYLYEVAEKYGADVVHSSYAVKLDSLSDSVNNVEPKLTVAKGDSSPVQELTIISNDPLDRFNEWINGGTFIDLQYNLFRRDFIFDNELQCDTNDGEPSFFALWWIMLAKVFVKTPVPCYIKRDNPYTQSNEKFYAPEYIEKFIIAKMNQSRDLDKLFHKVELFRDNEYLQYMIKAHIFWRRDEFFLFRNGVYKGGITPEFLQAAARAFRKYFGDDYFYPMFLFNFVHVLPYDIRVDTINVEHTTPPRCALSDILNFRNFAVHFAA